MSIVTLTTDFGGGGGVMRGVIWSITPDAKIADLTHQVTPQDIRMAAWLLDRQVFYYPKNSVHVVVVDPGVGTQRRPLAVQAGPQYFVGPDNGVFSLFYDRAEKEGWPLKIVHTNNPDYWLPKISNVFHGRDIFSPVGAHLSTGVPIEDLGEIIDDPVRIEMPHPVIKDNQAQGEVTLLFGYLGNIITNLHQDDLPDFPDLSKVVITIGDTTIQGLSRTFGEHQPGTLIALFGSSGYLMISVVNGNAVGTLKPEIGASIAINY